MSDRNGTLSPAVPAFAVEARRLAACPSCGSDSVTDLLSAPDRFHLRKELYHLVRCAECLLVWQACPPAPEQMGRHYTREYHDAIVSSGERFATDRWNPLVKLISEFKQGGALLDIGCSSGGFLSMMKSPAWTLYGIEMDELSAQRARSRTCATVFVGDALDVPIQCASFDAITCFDVLEHIYNPRQFLAKVWEWLKPEGIFCAVIPNIESWEARVFGTHWYGLELPRHLFHFSPSSLRRLATSFGLEEVLVKTPPTSYIERSVGYVCSDLFEKLGFVPAPQAHSAPPKLPLRVLRKAFRLAVIAPVSHMAALAGAGPSMEVVFRKPPLRDPF